LHSFQPAAVGVSPPPQSAYAPRLERTGSISIGAFTKNFSNFNGTSPAHVATLAELTELGVPDAPLYANGVFNSR